MKVSDLQLEEFKEGQDLLDHYRERLENGDVLTLLVVAERTDGQLEGGCTRTQDAFRLAGHMLYWALKRIGFKTEEGR